MANKINIYRGLLLGFFIFSLATKSFSFNPTENEGGTEEKFDAGKMILEHVADNHPWHLFGHTSIALPVILKTDKGLEVFSSSHFGHEGNESYKGELYTYAVKEGSVVILDNELGTVDEIATTALIDLSITKNVAAMLISMLLMAWIFISTANSCKKNRGKAPKGIQSLVEPIIIFVRDDVAKPSIGEKKYERFMPFLLTVFFFILINNLVGLIPGSANVTGNIAFTFTLAVMSFFVIVFSSNKHYWGHIFNPPVPGGVKPILVLVEFLSLFVKPLALMIRL